MSAKRSAASAALGLVGALLGFAGAEGGGAARAADLPPARLAIDLDSGRILEAQGADLPRWPASLAKMMTVYLAFEALEEGRIAGGDLVTVSLNAAAQPPSKLGLRAGERVRFDELVAAAAIASANDAAAAVGDALAGSETVFVDQMNAAARRLGMSRSAFSNASGLPRPGQHSTARDMALLARALLVDFPERAKLFSQTGGRAAGRRYRATNGLLGRYKGAFGLKTGFTCRAGYNLAAAARRGERRVLAVTLGHRTGAARRRAIAALLDRAFEAQGPQSDARPLLAAAAAAVGAPSPPSARACAPSRVSGLTGLSGWGVFLGARSSRAEAEQEIKRAEELAKTRGRVFITRRSGDGRWVAVLSGYGRAGAIRVCAAYRRAGGYCLTMSPTVLKNRAARWR